MSKRNSTGGGSNTLFNYFAKSPQLNKLQKTNASEDISSASLDTSSSSPRSGGRLNKNYNDNKRERTGEKEVKQGGSSDEDSPVAPKKKRIKIYSSNESDDSDAENKNINKVDNGNKELKSKLESSFKFEGSGATGSPGNKVKTPKAEIQKKVVSDISQSNQEVSGNDDGQSWLHCRLEWLKPDKIRDANKRRPDHPEYNPATLFVPEDFKKSQTPAHRQWWEMKASHYDCVLFFKVGKFYELYHMDASVGVNELGFSYMKGDFAHSGFPEIAYAKMASILVSKGYKVARVEQTETPEMMQERCKRTGMNSKYDKVVRREICQLTCKGTEICGLQDNGPSNAINNFLLCVAEEDQGNGSSQYGVCFIDTSIGLFNLGQFYDDQQCSRLLTTVAHFPPALIIYEKRITNGRTMKVFNTACYSARKEGLLPESQFWSSEKTLKMLAEKYYKTNHEGEWPEGLKPLLSESDILGLTPHKDFTLAIKALGGCVYFLKESLLDVQIMSMSQFTSYSPPGETAAVKCARVSSRRQGSNMVLDAITLRNLRIVDVEHSLYNKLNLCVTPMGKRLLHQWLCSPSCNLNVIEERQEAISYLLNNQSFAQDIRNILSALPDLERLLAKIHTLGNLRRATEHPDSRAIFFEEKIYSKKKVLDFISVLNGFESALKIVIKFEDCHSPMLKRIGQIHPVGKFPDYSNLLVFFKEGFNHTEAEKEGKIVPSHGVDKEYDASIERIRDIEEELNDYLKEQQKFFGCRVTYFGNDKRRYQLEVPEHAAKKARSDHQLEGSKKGAKRFSTAETKDMLARMISAEEQKSLVVRDLSRRIFEKFSQSYGLWQTAVQCLAIMDVLLSLTEYVRLQPGEMCIPKVHTAAEDEKPYLKILEGAHPCIALVEDFIPNDIQIGTIENGSRIPSLMLLTGPNMGGKSTLMRQGALLAIMAQIGCHIPARECSMTLIDRIFTRLGASDDILTGQSTFLVEMNETAAILRHASEHSLVLLDELGRGTSTYDGMAIAGAVVDNIADRGCRTIFSTHYHNLVEDFKNDDRVRLAHMACIVESEKTSEDDIPEETVTFLYKASDGACPKSYGFNVARLAGLPNRITKRGQQKANLFEKEAENVRSFRNIIKCCADGGVGLREMISKLCI